MMTHSKRRKLWEARIADYSQCKLSMRRWCEKHGVTDHQLRYWLKRFREKELDESSISWTPLEITSEHTAGIAVHIALLA